MKAVLAPKDLTKVLAEEINFLSQISNLKDPIINQFERLFLIKDEVPELMWPQQVCHDVHILDIDSITDASRKLKALGPYWANYSFCLHRRSELIQSQLPKIKNKKYNFLEPLPISEIGTWSLIESNKIICATKNNSKLPLREIAFNESKFPPSRAYLKLWELFTTRRNFPKKGDKVLDLGSCPGGWTWVLQQIGCHVLSVDKAPLDKRISALPNIDYLKKDAFKISPSDLGPIDWLFSDVICYPQDLYDLVQVWIKSNLVQHIVCTIKFQGQTDFTTLQKFREIKGSEIVHLCHNKHELTWIFNKN